MADRPRSQKPPSPRDRARLGRGDVDRRAHAGPFPELCRDALHDAARALERFVEGSGAALVLEDVREVGAAAIVERLGADATIVGVGFELGGEVQGPFAQILAHDDAARLAAALLERSDLAGRVGDESLGALAELGNIAASAFLNRLADALEGPCLPSVPRIVTGPASTTLPGLVGAAFDVAWLSCRLRGVPLHLCAAARPLVDARRPHG